MLDGTLSHLGGLLEEGFGNCNSILRAVGATAGFAVEESGVIRFMFQRERSGCGWNMA